jgi:hypothetical protein
MYDLAVALLAIIIVIDGDHYTQLPGRVSPVSDLRLCTSLDAPVSGAFTRSFQEVVAARL